MFGRGTGVANISVASASVQGGPTLDRLRHRYEGWSTHVILEDLILKEYPERIAAVSSFGAESAVILSFLAEIDRAVPVIFLDTGKHFPETLTYRDQLIERLGLTNVRSAKPETDALGHEDPRGVLHESDVERCCRIRKVKPLDTALHGYAAWITGRKRYHGGERARLEILEEVDLRIKVNPLAGWTPSEIAVEFRRRNLPVHPLVAVGYRSIGCAPCTSPIASDQPARSGRWSDSNKTECGIHRAPWAGTMGEQR